MPWVVLCMVSGVVLAGPLLSPRWRLCAASIAEGGRAGARVLPAGKRCLMPARASTSSGLCDDLSSPPPVTVPVRAPGTRMPSTHLHSVGLLCRRLACSWHVVLHGACDPRSLCARLPSLLVPGRAFPSLPRTGMTEAATSAIIVHENRHGAQDVTVGTPLPCMCWLSAG